MANQGEEAWLLCKWCHMESCRTSTHTDTLYNLGSSKCHTNVASFILCTNIEQTWLALNKGTTCPMEMKTLNAALGIDTSKPTSTMAQLRAFLRNLSPEDRDSAVAGLQNRCMVLDNPRTSLSCVYQLRCCACGTAQQLHKYLHWAKKNPFITHSGPTNSWQTFTSGKCANVY